MTARVSIIDDIVDITTKKNGLKDLLAKTTTQARDEETAEFENIAKVKSSRGDYTTLLRQNAENAAVRADAIRAINADIAKLDELLERARAQLDTVTEINAAAKVPPPPTIQPSQIAPPPVMDTTTYASIPEPSPAAVPEEKTA